MQHDDHRTAGIVVAALTHSAHARHAAIDLLMREHPDLIDDAARKILEGKAMEMIRRRREKEQVRPGLIVMPAKTKAAAGTAAETTVNGKFKSPGGIRTTSSYTRRRSRATPEAS